MPDKPDFLKDYVDVKERVRLFYERYPDGRLVTAKVRVTTQPDGVPRVWVKALAYRTADDPLPAPGWSWLALPGTTNYTRGSELENTETSAWGRAIGALGIGIDKSIASADEVKTKEGGERTPLTGKASADEPAEMRPESKGEAEAFLGILTKSGVVRKGGSSKYQLNVYQTPAGPSFGFRLELAEPDESGGHKAIPQVLVPPEVAVPLLADIGGDPAVLEKQTVRVKGHLFQVSSPGRQSYYRLLVREWRDGERVIPPEEAPSVPMFQEPVLPEPPDDVPLVGETPEAVVRKGKKP